MAVCFLRPGIIYFKREKNNILDIMSIGEIDMSGCKIKQKRAKT